MKKALVIAVFVLVVVLGGAFYYLKGKRYEIVITQEKIDAGLAARFPATKNYLVFKVTYSDPQVTLLEAQDRIQVGLDATLTVRFNGESKEFEGGVTVRSAIRYDSEQQEFYLDDAEFDRLEIHGIPDQWLDRVTDFVGKASKEFIETKPIYRLEARDAKTTAAKMLLKGFEVRDRAIYVTLGI